MRILKILFVILVAFGFTLVVPQAEHLPQTISLNHPQPTTEGTLPHMDPSNLFPPPPDEIPKPAKNQFLPKSEEEIIDVINRKRLAYGLEEVTPLDTLTCAARIRAEEMSENNYFEHQRPNGDRWYTVLSDDLEFDYLSAGENIAVMYVDLEYPLKPFKAEKWYNIWENSPTHYATMMDPDFDYIGAGVFQFIKDGKYYTYATTIFAKL